MIFPTFVSKNSNYLCACKFYCDKSNDVKSPQCNIMKKTQIFKVRGWMNFSSKLWMKIAHVDEKTENGWMESFTSKLWMK